MFEKDIEKKNSMTVKEADSNIFLPAFYLEHSLLLAAHPLGGLALSPESAAGQR